MFGIRAVLLLSLVINVLVNGYQDDEHLDGELEVLLKRLQERLEDEERGYELQDLFERGWGSVSGIVVAPEVTAMYQDMKLNNIYKWVTFKIEGRRRIVCDKSASPSDKDDEAQFNEMKNGLTSEPRYILFDFNFKSSTTEGRQITKIAFIFWLDKTHARTTDKMYYASSKDTVEREFAGLGVEFLTNEMDELDYETLRVEVEKKYPI